MSAVEVIVQRYRGDGTTSKQMLLTPQGAVYVWCNHYTGYAEDLKRKLSREDLVIVQPDWFTSRRWLGLTMKAIVLDHATTLDRRQYEEYQIALTRVRA